MMRRTQSLLYMTRAIKPPVRTKIPVVGETGYATLLLGAQSMKYSGYISEHDYKIASKLAFVLAGGRVAFWFGS